MSDTDNTPKKQRGRPFQAGKSGNAAGRPAGARNKATLAMQALLDGEAEALTRKAVEMALAGDMGALRLCLERLLPVTRERTVCFTMPPIKKVGDALHAMDAITNAVADGELTLSEATELSKIIERIVVAVKQAENDRWNPFDNNFGAAFS